jgi:hypothetical protein
MSYDVEALRKAKDVKGLITTLRHGSPPEQCEAAKALGSVGNKHAIRPLAKALKHGDLSVQVAAAEALGTMGGPKTVRPLCKALKHPDGAVNKAAAIALGMTGDPRAIDPLCEALAGGDRHGLVGAAAKALGMIRDPRLVGPLSEALDHVGPRTVLVIHTFTETDNAYAFEALAAFTEKHPSPACKPWLEEMESRVTRGKRDQQEESDAVTTIRADEARSEERSSPSAVACMEQTTTSETGQCARCQRSVVKGLSELTTGVDFYYGPGDRESEWPAEQFQMGRVVAFLPVPPEGASVYGGTCQRCGRTYCIVCMNEAICKRLAKAPRAVPNVPGDGMLLDENGELWCPECETRTRTVKAW